MTPEQLTQTIDNSPELIKLENELKRKYPSHHWNHVNVWSKFWYLVEAMGEA